ncbi:activator of Hsp90 ATPase [Obelidium mucronatum]|nr:activator of Hsp90 ATPase [Obelidium mucronatum]
MSTVNHNNWHWIERNCLPWAKTHLARKIKSIKAGNGFVITSVVNVEGQADINQRKGKLITVYDLQFVVTWKGTDSMGSPASGQISIVDFMHDTDMDELEYYITVDNKQQQSSASKEVEKHVIGKLKDILNTFSTDMLNENSKNLLNEVQPSVSNAGTPADVPSSPVQTPKSQVKAAPTTSPSAAATSALPPKKTRTTTIGVESQFLCTASDIYDTFLNPERVKVWSKDSKVAFMAKPGKEYSLFGGNVTGRFCEMNPCNKIVFTWRLKSWPESYKSNLVTISMDEFDDAVRVRVKQEDVPVDEVEAIKRNWEAYYFAPIRTSLDRLASVPKVTKVVDHRFRYPGFQERTDGSAPGGLSKTVWDQKDGGFSSIGTIGVVGLVGAVLAFVLYFSTQQ